MPQRAPFVTTAQLWPRQGAQNLINCARTLLAASPGPFLQQAEAWMNTIQSMRSTVSCPIVPHLAPRHRPTGF